MLRIVKTGGLGLIGCALAVLAIILVRGAIEAPAPLDPAALIERATDYDVVIRRDEWGVPHVLGKTDADAAFGVGFAHAEDDYATIEEVAIATRGQLASIKGQQAAVSDYLVHLMRVWETVEARYDSDLSPEVRRVIEAYADGVNY
ncbi:MAG: penicillin acylase family protein [Parvibaculum sp.]|nr:penicillin acylase family protein [Parvibaculum sp.]